MSCRIGCIVAHWITRYAHDRGSLLPTARWASCDLGRLAGFHGLRAAAPHNVQARPTRCSHVSQELTHVNETQNIAGRISHRAMPSLQCLHGQIQLDQPRWVFKHAWLITLHCCVDAQSLLLILSKFLSGARSQASESFLTT